MHSWKSIQPNAEASHTTQTTKYTDNWQDKNCKENFTKTKFLLVVDSLGPLVTVVADQYTPGILVKRKPHIPIAICNLVKKFPGGQLNAHLP